VQEELEGQIKSVIWSSEDGGFSIMRLLSDGSSESITITGYLAGTSPGERVRLKGQWETHPKYGRQLKVEECVPLLPASAEGIEQYLGSGLVEGIGPAMAGRIVARFGEEALRVIDETPGRLSEVQGIGPKRISAITKAWQSQRGVRDTMLFLQSHGVSPGYAARIYRQYGDRAVQVVRENPYRLAQDVEGIGFLLADRFARGLGFGEDSPARAEAGIMHALKASSEEGHLFLPSTELLQQSQKLLESDRAIIAGALESLIASGRVKAERLGAAPAAAPAQDMPPATATPVAAPGEPPAADTTGGPPDLGERAIYLPALHAAETGIVTELERLLKAPRSLPRVEATEAVARAQTSLSITLAPKQAEAVARALREKLLLITGGPGTGKTTIQRALLTVLDHIKAQPLFAAPTGRAAKRLAEATGREARTIHRLLEFAPHEKRFRRDRDEPLECDLLIVDEASMIDAPLMHSLLKALPSDASLILVGDAHQLPSVGPGTVLADLIASGRLPVVELTDIFRQSEDSRIVTNAHRINLGLSPLANDSEEGGDFFFIEQEDPVKVGRTIVELVCRRIPRRFHLDPVDDVQVLSPMHRGDAGVENLNRLLQEALNPSGSEVMARSKTLRVHDKVMQLRNDYEREVFNGDIGRIAAVDTETGAIVVDLDGRHVEYERADLDALTLAYAVSVHKSQGGEFPAVIICLLTQHFPLLQRNLLYTAVTRGKRLVVIVGSRKAMAIALRNDTPRRRNSLLASRLAYTLQNHIPPGQVKGSG
jgi:exodeoxyribonuclease V alpha subunit